MISSKIRQIYIDQVANRIFKDHPDLLCAPVNVEELASRLEIRILPKEFSNKLEGMSIKESSRKTVLVSERCSPIRKRLVISHEIGHLCIHADLLSVDREIFNLDSSVDAQQSIKELEANYFASVILMPEILLKVKIAEMNIKAFGEQQIDVLAKSFFVSPQTLLHRLQSLQIIT